MKRLFVLFALLVVLALLLFLFLSFDVTVSPRFSAEATFCPSHKLFFLRIGVPPACKEMGEAVLALWGVVWDTLPLYLSHPTKKASSAVASLFKEADRALFADFHICAGARS